MRRPSPSSIKRRKDELFREAKNLSVTTGAQIAVITIAPNGVTRAHGCPSVDSVINRYLRHTLPTTADASFPSKVEELCEKYMEQPTEEEPGKEGLTAKESELKDLKRSLECKKKLREDLLKRVSSSSSPKP